MESENLRKIIDALTRENEENLYQMSIVRLVAESVVSGLQDTGYFTRLCSDFLQIFEASVCALFQFRRREPSGWWLEAWAGGSSGLYPVSDLLPEHEEGLLEWVRQRDNPLYLENVEDDPAIRFWGPNVPDKVRFALIPVNFDDLKMGAIVLIDPIMHMSSKNIIRFIHILSSLIKSGFNNRVLYKGLHDAKEAFYDLFENASDMAVVVFPDGVIRDCNQAFRKKLGVKGDSSDNIFTDLIKEEPGGNFSRCWAKLIKGEEVQNVDVLLKGKNGKYIETELSGNVNFQTNGSVGFIRLYLRDVTEKRRNERLSRELEMKVKLMRQRELAQVGLYVTGIAHNLQNPIHIIQGHLTLLKKKGVDSPEVGIIEEHTNNITGIVGNLLDKISRERNTKPTDVDLNWLLQSELKFLEANMFYKHDVKKEFHFADNLPKLKGLYGDFSQAIMNIVYNALDAMKGSMHRQLTIRTEFDSGQGEVRLSISDSGPGVAQDVGDRIFEPFFTTKGGSEDAKNGLSSGSGLGLSSARSLLEPYQGSISYESIPGEGTTFYITFKVTAKGRKARKS